MPTAEDLTQFVGSTLGLKSVSPDSAMGDDRRWDSLNQVSLILALEQAYDVSISPDLIGELISIPAIIEFFRTEGRLQE